MTELSSRRLLTAVGLIGVSVALAGCMGSGTTYGTGKSPGSQTLEDLAGIAAIGGLGKKEPIDYGPRAPVVPPPPGTPLPPPGSEQSSLAANWPKDPDVEAKKFKADAQTRYQPGEGQPFGANDPKFRLPPKPKSEEPSQALLDIGMKKVGDDAHSTAEQTANAKKLFADSRGAPTDANGQPIRQYLTDPPPEYRAPDPTAPTELEVTPPKKKFKWPWQQ